MATKKTKFPFLNCLDIKNAKNNDIKKSMFKTLLNNCNFMAIPLNMTSTNTKSIMYKHRTPNAIGTI